MKELHFEIKNIGELPEAAARILQFAGLRKVFAFYAEMGAGKTTLIKEMCRNLGVYDSFSSPSYSIVNEYHITATHQSVYHMDLYRLKKTEEAIEAGVMDYVSGSNYCFIEWPELANRLLPDEVVKVHIKTDGNIRNVSIFMG